MFKDIAIPWQKKISQPFFIGAMVVPLGWGLLKIQGPYTPYMVIFWGSQSPFFKGSFSHPSSIPPSHIHPPKVMEAWVVLLLRNLPVPSFDALRQALRELQHALTLRLRLAQSAPGSSLCASEWCLGKIWWQNRWHLEVIYFLVKFVRQRGMQWQDAWF